MFAGVGIFSLSSCNMDEEPTTSITVKDGEKMITTDNLLQYYRNGIATSFRSTLYGNNSMIDEVMCDGFNATIDYGNNYGPVHRTDKGFTDSNDDIASYWSREYSSISDYDIFIDEANKYYPTAASSIAAKNTAKGEAFFYRAFAYLQLARHFGKDYNPSTASSDLCVPLVLHYDQEAKPARATVAEVYKQIKEDLDSASTLLAGVAGEIRSQRPTIDAVNALYARYYLDTEDYANAAASAIKVLNSAAGYKLSSTMKEMKDEWQDDKGTEPIMQMPGSLTENGTGTNSYYTRCDSYAALTQYKISAIYLDPYFLPSQKVLNLYGDKDLRGMWFSDGYWYLDNNYHACLIGSGLFMQDFYTFNKYLGNPSLTSSYANARQLPKPLLISEMYLIAAEAEFDLGKTAEAKEILNELQTSRGAEATEATAENIRNEWFKETIGEGLRFSCLKRWHTGFNGRAAQPGALKDEVIYTSGDGSTYTGKNFTADDPHWQWPIPSHEIQLNSNLVQNEGY